jgi:uncharacterized protein (DUF2062 family)
LALRDRLREVISTNDSPKKIALSFSLGVFIGLSPFLGMHTILGISAVWLFRTNKYVTIASVYVTNPWTIVPIYTFSTWLGTKLFGVDIIIPQLKWHAISCLYLFNEVRFLLWPFIFGSMLVALVSSFIVYLVVYHAVVKQRKLT